MSAGDQPVRIYFDASRLIARGNQTPTGIDRVDLAYVRHLRKAAGFDLRLIRFDVFGARMLHRHEADALIEQTIERWKLTRSAPADSTEWQRLTRWLSEPIGSPAPWIQIDDPGMHPRSNPPAWRQIMRRPIRLRDTSERLRGRPADHPRLYLNTSHGRLFRASVSRWLRGARIPAVFFVHDLIPIEFPQFNRPREPLRHQARLETISRHANCVLVNSRATADSLRDYLTGNRKRVPLIHVAPLGIEKSFARVEPDPVVPAHPYFVVLGTIEPRKNHALLLDVWRRWLEQDARSVPRLVIVGRRGWLNERVFEAIADPALSRHIVECAGLSDSQVGTLLTRARALLCPSHAEGFSLPVAEALVAGTPVIASDIPAHRELAREYASFADPLDVAAWTQQIQACVRAGTEARRQVSGFRSLNWEQHFETVLPILRDAAMRR